MLKALDRKILNFLILFSEVVLVVLVVLIVEVAALVVAVILILMH